MFPTNDSPFWPWLYYLTTMSGMGLWMKYGYTQGFDVSKDGPALVMFVAGIAGIDVFNRWKHKKEVAKLKTNVKKLKNAVVDADERADDAEDQ